MNAPVPHAEVAQRYRLRASDFEVLHEAGALRDVRKAELIDGDIFGMSPQTNRHARAKTELAFAIRQALGAIGSDLKTVVEVSVVVAEDSVPEPDIVVSSYTGHRFVPAETVALLVEVSTSTRAIDLGRKAALYAAAGIPEYWVIDFESKRVFAHSRPGSEGYCALEEVAFGDELASAAVEGLNVPTGFLLD